MSDRQNASVAIRLLFPSTDDEWKHAEALITELKEWDVRHSQALGFAADEVISVFYPDNIGAVRRQSIQPDGCLVIALDESRPVGCAAFRRLTASACELYNVYVRPSHRGRAIGAALLQRLLGEAKAASYGTMCLETATFMHAAHILYKSFNFQVRKPYRSVAPRFADATIWMECVLAGEPGRCQ
jgi:GNAT superfamily N-acetyltransferase